MAIDQPSQLQLIAYKAYADLKSEAARGYLGWLWWIIEPLLYLAAFYVVFGIALKHDEPGFVPSLLIGLVVWKWFDVAAKMSATAISAGRGLMAQVYLPKQFFALVVIFRNTVKFALTLVLLLAFLLLFSDPTFQTWVALPLLLFLQLLLITGVGLLLSAIVPLWPDLKMVVDNGLMLMFFLSGIFFDISRVEGLAGDVLRLNPMAIFVLEYRKCLLRGEWPDAIQLVAIGLVSIIVLLLGVKLLKRFDQTYPRLL